MLLKGLGLFFFLSIFCLHWMAYGILVPWPGIEPMPPAVEAWCLNDWTTRDVPDWVFLYPKCLAQPLAHSRSSINICWIKFSCSYGLGLFDDVSARFLGTFEIYVWLLLGKPLQSHFWFWLDDSECWQMKKVTLHSDMGKHYRISEILNTNLNKIDMRGINKDTTLFLGNRGGFCVVFFFFIPPLFPDRFRHWVVLPELFCCSWWFPILKYKTLFFTSKSAMVPQPKALYIILIHIWVWQMWIRNCQDSGERQNWIMALSP